MLKEFNTRKASHFQAAADSSSVTAAHWATPIRIQVKGLGIHYLFIYLFLGRASTKIKGHFS